MSDYNNDVEGEEKDMFIVESSSPTMKLVLQFAILMEAKLGRNRHKGDREGWLSCELDWLVARLDDEVRELKEAIALQKDPIMICEEAADVANFALMVCDHYTTTKSREEKEPS